MINVATAVFTKAPLVPVIVMAYVPGGAVAWVVILKAAEPVPFGTKLILPGVNEPLVLAGKPVCVKLTTPLKALLAVPLIWKLAGLPATTFLVVGG